MTYKIMAGKLLALLIALVPANALAQQKDWSEFMGGNRLTYSTKGQEKAKGIELSFDYPSSWLGRDGRRPNTLYQVTSEQGTGMELCNLVIRELPLPADYTPTKAEIEEIFTTQSLTDFIPSGAVFIDGAPTKLDGQPGAWIHYSLQTETAGMKVQLETITYPFYYDKKLVLFSCNVAADAQASPAALNQNYKAFFPLFQQMANSLIVHSRWKNPPAP